MANEKRNVEVFTAGCPLCEPVVKLVQEVACDNCNVTIYNLNDAEGAERAKAAGIKRVPMVLVDEKPAECCTSSVAFRGRVCARAQPAGQTPLFADTTLADCPSTALQLERQAHQLVTELAESRAKVDEAMRRVQEVESHERASFEAKQS